METCKVLTVIIPTYNMECLLDKCLSSLIVDDVYLFSKLEVLIINDGSSDGSSRIAHQYESLYTDIFRTIDKENGHYGSCINVGLSKARGKYVKILDADDSFFTQNLEEYLLLLDKNNVDLVLNKAYVYNEYGEFIRHIGISKQLKHSSVLPFNKIVTDDIADSIQMHNVAYKTSKIVELKYKQTEGVCYSDAEWISAPMVTVESILVFDKPLYKYLQGRGGQSSNEEMKRKQFRDVIKVTFSMIEFYSNYDGDKWHISYLKTKLMGNLSGFYLYANKIGLNFVVDFENVIKEKYPQLYKERKTWELGYDSDCKFVCMYHERWWYFIKKIFSIGYSKTMRQFDEACYWGLMKPLWFVAIINRVRNLLQIL